MSSHGSDVGGVAARVREGLRSETALLLLGLVVAETLLLVGYFGLTSTQLSAVRYALYPFVWINVGLIAIWRTRPARSSDRRRLAGAAVAVAYLAVLSYAGGLVAPGSGVLDVAARVDVSPGYGPVVLVDVAVASLTLIPYKVVGYLALTYLVYATVLDAAGSAVTGVVGLFSCVSCTWPVLASVATGVLGGSAPLANLVVSYSLDLSLVVFLSAVALLYWRPGFGD